MNKKILVIAIIGIGVISFAFASPLFHNTEIDEPIPVSTIEESINDNNTPTYEGVFVGVDDGIHNAEGITRTIPLDDSSQVLRLEDFKSTNGPDLFVYLSVDKDATDFVNLGELKANKGNQNYEIPSGTDLEKYNKVLIWCKSFSTLFGSAELKMVP